MTYTTSGTRTNVGQGLILSVGNWLDGFWFAIGLLSHVIERLFRKSPKKRKYVIAKGNGSYFITRHIKKNVHR